MNETEMQIQIMEAIQPQKAFKLRYYADHNYCPKCGHDNCVSTLAAYPFEPNDPTSFKDENICSCGKCGDVHKVHDRVKTQPI
jgi:transcription elongation factor Elf1